MQTGSSSFRKLGSLVIIKNLVQARLEMLLSTRKDSSKCLEAGLNRWEWMGLQISRKHESIEDIQWLAT